jgi:hypothetical protein
VGTGVLTLPSQGVRSRDGYVFRGWSLTPGGAVLTNFQPTASGTLFAVWGDANFIIKTNAGNTDNPALPEILVLRGTAIALPTPTRANFSFLGWFDSETGGNLVGMPGASFSPVASQTIYGRWVQNSFAGVDTAALERATEFVAGPDNEYDLTINHNPSGSRARIQIPAGVLPDGTVVSVRYFKDAYRQKQLIGQEKSYFFSIIVSWLYGTGPTATVPDTLFDSTTGLQIPITVTLSNSQIKAGAMVYQIIGGVVTPIKRVTEDGSVQIKLFSDPELVVAVITPDAPTNVRAVSGSRESTVVTWDASASDGGSDLTGYNVYIDGNLVCTTTQLRCEVNGLNNSRTYSVRVMGVNRIGESDPGSAAFTTFTPVVVPVSEPTVATPPNDSDPTSCLNSANNCDPTCCSEPCNSSKHY